MDVLTRHFARRLRTSPKHSGNLSTCQIWWAQWWALGTREGPSRPERWLRASPDGLTASGGSKQSQGKERVQGETGVREISREIAGSVAGSRPDRGFTVRPVESILACSADSVAVAIASSGVMSDRPAYAVRIRGVLHFAFQLTACPERACQFNASRRARTMCGHGRCASQRACAAGGA
jgi:hypothetical protein